MVVLSAEEDGGISVPGLVSSVLPSSAGGAGNTGGTGGSGSGSGFGSGTSGAFVAAGEGVPVGDSVAAGVAEGVALPTGHGETVGHGEKDAHGETDGQGVKEGVGSLSRKSNDTGLGVGRLARSVRPENSAIWLLASFIICPTAFCAFSTELSS